MRVDSFRQLAGPFHMLAQAVGQSAPPEIAKDKPELKRSESATQRQPIVHVIGSRLSFGGLEIVRFQRKCLLQNSGIVRVKNTDIDGREQPLMGIDDDRIGQLASI